MAATVKGDRDRIPKEAKFSQEAFDNLKPAAKKAALRSGFVLLSFSFFP